MASASDAPSLAPPIPAPLKGFRLFLAAFSVSLSYFLVMLDLTVANVAVPHIAGSLGVSTTQGTLIITSYAIAEAICLPLSGWLAKRFGTVQTFIFGLIGFAIASALCGMARSLEAIIVFRVFQCADAALVPDDAAPDLSTGKSRHCRRPVGHDSRDRANSGTDRGWMDHR